MNEKKSKNAPLLLLLCLPMIFIVYFAISFSGAEISLDEVKSVSLTLPDGGALELTDGEDIAFYVNLYLDADELSKTLRNVEEEGHIGVKLNMDDKVSEYFLYPELNVNGCFYERAEGGYASISPVNAKALLSRPECEYLYADSLLPSLSLVTAGNEREILPQSYSWQFKKLDGSFYSDTASAHTSEAQSFSFYANDGCDFKFSVPPTEYTVTFFDKNGSALATNDITSLIFATDTKLSAKIEATWVRDSSSDYGGNASYSFDVLYDVLPEISVSALSANTGDVIVATFRHFSDSETISLDTMLKTAPLSINYTEELAFAYLPVSLENESGVYSLNFKVGSSTKSFDLTVIKTSGEFVNVTYDAEKYTASVTPAAIEEYRELIATVSETVMPAYFDEGSVFSPTTTRSVLYKFGTDILANGIPPSARLEGTDYASVEGDSVKSAERGYVVFVGETVKTGKTVIIEHGYGIKTHYYHLESVSKSEGTIIQKGEILGIAGKTGLTADTTLHFAVSVNGIFVDPAPFFENGIPVPAE